MIEQLGTQEQETKRGQLDTEGEKDKKEPEQPGAEEAAQGMLKSVHDIYFPRFDILKMLGSGNAAGVLTVGAAISHFANRPTILAFIKAAGVCFFVGVFCFAISLVLLVGIYTAGTRVSRAIRLKNAHFEYDDAIDHIMRLVTALPYFEIAGVAAFFVGCLVSFFILFFA